jgi:VRR-NUC domain
MGRRGGRSLSAHLNPDEASFQSVVVEVARLAGWKVAHFRAARTAKGWRTPVTADGAVWPDLVLVRPPRIAFAELKSDGGKLRPSQSEWLDVLRLLPQVETYLWRPKDWDSLVETLTGSRP